MRNWEGHPFCRYHFEQLSNHIAKVGFLFMMTSDLEQENTHIGIYFLAWASQEERFIVVKWYEIVLAQFFMVTSLERSRLKGCSSKNKIIQILSGKRSVGEACICTGVARVGDTKWKEETWIISMYCWFPDTAVCLCLCTQAWYCQAF